MGFSIELPVQMEEQLKNYCIDNDIDVQEFVFNCIADKLYTNLYGDLNEKQTKAKTTDKPSKQSKTTTTVKRGKKDKTEEQEPPVEIEVDVKVEDTPQKEIDTQKTVKKSERIIKCK